MSASQEVDMENRMLTWVVRAEGRVEELFTALKILRSYVHRDDHAYIDAVIAKAEGEDGATVAAELRRLRKQNAELLAALNLIADQLPALSDGLIELDAEAGTRGRLVADLIVFAYRTIEDAERVQTRTTNER
ncbi:MAG: hypothetical protein EPN21_15680 [Methylococcaceae bacterium]|nr:MAG: hypothetical protein EPN21_15680 [Methylococcaceae bacterium]